MASSTGAAAIEAIVNGNEHGEAITASIYGQVIEPRSSGPVVQPMAQVERRRGHHCGGDDVEAIAGSACSPTEAAHSGGAGLVLSSEVVRACARGASRRPSA
jgi:hypothetical protein